jgi:hypothetical protein
MRGPELKRACPKQGSGRKEQRVVVDGDADEIDPAWWSDATPFVPFRPWWDCFEARLIRNWRTDGADLEQDRRRVFCAVFTRIPMRRVMASLRRRGRSAICLANIDLSARDAA